MGFGISNRPLARPFPGRDSRWVRDLGDRYDVGVEVANACRGRPCRARGGAPGRSGFGLGGWSQDHRRDHPVRVAGSRAGGCHRRGPRSPRHAARPCDDPVSDRGRGANRPCRQWRFRRRGHCGGVVPDAPALRVLRVARPADASLEHVEGSITDSRVLRSALNGCDSFINLVMQYPGVHGGGGGQQSVEMIQAPDRVNTRGPHLRVYTGTSSGTKRRPHEHDDRAQSEPSLLLAGGGHRALATRPGSTAGPRGFGDQICQYFAHFFDMNLIALRITGTRSLADYLEALRTRHADDVGPLFETDEEGSGQRLPRSLGGYSSRAWAPRRLLHRR